ncbi:MAG: ATP-dependent DNA helicase RecQ family [Ignavibacteria bacterium]|nr:MAG: ATP-dependent DNA helicase RecQ family [Ignavibacteria bacterium]KAF0161361.1 MAG: ATP-dependent DNA helicase RecQ family [Ignavibacteria bacterium]
MKPIDVLRKYFGYEQFRTGQEEIINAIISGNCVLAVLPTGAGKSLCYQIPALLSTSFAIVISPLIALMKDQVDSLNKNEIIASFINSSQDFRAGEKVLQEVASGKTKILYVSPEKLANSAFVEKIKHLSPEYVFIDEAHCISEWGHNFRPSYRKIHEFIEIAKVQKVSAFTATATEEVRLDILKQLSLTNPKVFVRGFERDNLSLNVVTTTQKKGKAVEILRNNKLPAIIYTATRNGAEELTEYLRKEMINTVFYHAGLPSEMKRIIQDDFMTGRVKVICATNAFGMGIDKNDIRLVVHYNMPGSIENYYQEIGRAGRDSKPSKIFLLYEERDKQIQDFFINSSSPTREQIELLYNCICDYGKVALGMVNTVPIAFDTGLQNLLELKKLTSGIVQSAAKVLNESGYLQLKSDLLTHHSVRFPLKPDQLRSFILNFADAKHKDLVVILAKRFGSKIFSEFCRIDIKTTAELLETDEEEIINDLSELARGGIIEHQKPQKNPSFVLAQPRVHSKVLKLNLLETSKIKKNLQNKLKMMVEYVSSEQCRMSYMLNYFGQSTEGYECGKCDNCNKDKQNSTIEYLDEIILQTLHEVKHPLRIKTILQILHGSSTLGNLKKFSSFGTCVHFGKEDIEDAIQQLVISKKILFSNDTIKLSEFGIDLFADDKLTEAKEALVDYEYELKMFNKLRQVRKEASDKFAQQPHLICSDEILRTISKVKPQSHSALLSIAGFNQRMYNKIGEDILNAVKEEIKICGNKVEYVRNNLPRKSKLILELVEKKYSLEEIAELSKTSESLLAIQLEGLISLLPNFDINSLINKDDLHLINQKIKEGITEIKELKNALGSKISYSKIRLVLAKYNFS